MIPEFRRIGENGKAAGQVSVYEVIFLAALRLVSLFGQDAVVISVERLRLFAGTCIARCFCEVAQFAQRAFRLTGWNMPVQAVLFAFSAAELAGVLFHFGAVVSLGEVLLLSVSDSAAR